MIRPGEYLVDSITPADDRRMDSPTQRTAMTRYESKPRPLPGTWADNAACKNTSVAFFPDLEGLTPGSSSGTRWATPALQICAGCPVKDQCLTYAIDNSETDGVWGGTLPKDRASIARRHTPTGPDASHCANGHPWADNEMRAQTTTRSWRRCRTCTNEQNRRWRERNR